MAALFVLKSHVGMEIVKYHSTNLLNFDTFLSYNKTNGLRDNIKISFMIYWVYSQTGCEYRRFYEHCT